MTLETTYYTFRHGPYRVQHDGARYAVHRADGSQASNGLISEREAKTKAELWNSYYAGWIMTKGTPAEKEPIP